MYILPPGVILQLMYLKDRLKLLKPGYFIEIGPGSGEITKLLLDMGWKGLSYDLDAITVDNLKSRFSNEIKSEKYLPINEDFLAASTSLIDADLVISCMVMEHLDNSSEYVYMKTASKFLKEKNGLFVGLVPGSPAHWGIEDDIAGHYRRYTHEVLLQLMINTGYKLDHIAGLTFPVSNLLFPLSNFLVKRAEFSKLILSDIEKTKLSGRRNVRFKTSFPILFGLFLNKYMLFPFYIIQKIFKNSERSLVIYFESKLK